MVWTATADRATGFLIPASLWNEMLGASGNLEELKSHTHDGTDGDGATSLGPLVLGDFTDAAAPAAPGAGKSRIYATSGRPRTRAGAAGADSLIALDPTTAQADLLYATAAGVLAALAKGTALQLLRMNAGATAPEWSSATGTLSAGTSCVMNPLAPGVQATAHGLGAIPDLIVFYMECLTAEIGYSIGDRFYPSIYMDEGGGTNAGLGVAADATNVTIAFDNVISILRKDTGALGNVTAGSWKAVAVPYKIT